MPMQRPLLFLHRWQVGNWTKGQRTERARHKRARKITILFKIALTISLNSVISAGRRVCLSGRSPHLGLRDESLCSPVGVGEVIVLRAHSRKGQILLQLCSFVTNGKMLPGYQIKPHPLIMIFIADTGPNLALMGCGADAVMGLNKNTTDTMTSVTTVILL